MKRKALGKGLRSLIRERPAKVKESTAPAPPETDRESGEKLLQIDLDLIQPNRVQPRQEFDDEALEELSRSLKMQGVLQPVVVTNRLRNLPRKGVYNWNPGAHFGIYRPDTFWFTDAGRDRARRK